MGNGYKGLIDNSGKAFILNDKTNIRIQFLEGYELIRGETAHTFITKTKNGTNARKLEDIFSQAEISYTNKISEIDNKVVRKTLPIGDPRGFKEIVLKPGEKIVIEDGKAYIVSPDGEKKEVQNGSVIKVTPNKTITIDNEGKIFTAGKNGLELHQIKAAPGQPITLDPKQMAEFEKLAGDEGADKLAFVGKSAAEIAAKRLEELNEKISDGLKWLQNKSADQGTQQVSGSLWDAAGKFVNAGLQALRTGGKIEPNDPEMKEKLDSLLAQLREGQALEIGRSSKVQTTGNIRLKMDNATISVNHAQIIKSPNGFLIKNESSTNPVFINGEQIAGNPLLRDGDVIQLGDRIVVFNTPAEPLLLRIEDAQSGSQLISLPQGVANLPNEYPLGAIQRGFSIVIGQQPNTGEIIGWKGLPADPQKLVKNSQAGIKQYYIPKRTPDFWRGVEPGRAYLITDIRQDQGQVSFSIVNSEGKTVRQTLPTDWRHTYINNLPQE